MSRRTSRKKQHAPSPLAKRVENALELPTGAMTGAARLEITDNKRAVVEGCHGILEYDEAVIRLNTGSGFIRFTGSDLCISCLTDNSAVVTGLIAAIEFIS